MRGDYSLKVQNSFAMIDFQDLRTPYKFVRVFGSRGRQ